MSSPHIIPPVECILAETSSGHSPLTKRTTDDGSPEPTSSRSSSSSPVQLDTALIDFESRFPTLKAMGHHSAVDVPDGWTDPVNSIELGPSSSPEKIGAKHVNSWPGFKKNTSRAPIPLIPSIDGMFNDAKRDEGLSHEKIQQAHLRILEYLEGREEAKDLSAPSMRERYLRECRQKFDLTDNPELADKLLRGSYPVAEGSSSGKSVDNGETSNDWSWSALFADRIWTLQQETTPVHERWCYSCKKRHDMVLNLDDDQGDDEGDPYEAIKERHQRKLKWFEEKKTETGDIDIWVEQRQHYLRNCQKHYHLENCSEERADELLPGSYPYLRKPMLVDSGSDNVRDTAGDNVRDTAGDNAGDTAGETAEEVMNLPPSYTPPSHRPADLQNILTGDRDPTNTEVEALSQRRSELEANVKEDLEHQQQDAEETGDIADAQPLLTPAGVSGPSLSDLQDQAGAVPIAPGVVVVDPDQLDKLLSSDAGLVEYGSGAVPKELPIPVRDSDLNWTAPKISVDSYQVDGAGPSSHIPGPHTSCASSKSRPSSSRRVSFAPTPTIIETPFTSTLNYFKSFNGIDDRPRGGKENSSPHKPRRNASLPEEIAELNREANGSELDDEFAELNREAQNTEEEDNDLTDLDKYREMDLAPLDPVMEDNKAGDLIAGDLIMAKAGSPRPLVRVRSMDLEEYRGVGFFKEKGREKEAVEMTPTRESSTFEVHVPGHFHATKLKFETNSSTVQVAEFIRDRARDLDASEVDIEETVNSFLEEPESFIVVDAEKRDTCESGEITGESGAPVFINIISMIPVTLFCAAVQPLAYYSNKAYEAVLDRFGTLTLHGKEEDDD